MFYEGYTGSRFTKSISLAAQVSLQVFKAEKSTQSNDGGNLVDEKDGDTVMESENEQSDPDYKPK